MAKCAVVGPAKKPLNAFTILPAESSKDVSGSKMLKLMQQFNDWIRDAGRQLAC
jgi:hypothetical protein